ncbi:MAG: 2-phosphosulfolactate phosphatase [Bacteroidota bacterium]
MKPTIEVCFTPKLFPCVLTEDNCVVVVVDILRATTSICAAFANNVKSIIPVAKPEVAMRMKNIGFLVAAERDGKKLDFADFGNSPKNFMTPEVKGKEIVYSTTNGTQAIDMSKKYGTVAIGAFTNLSALTKWLLKQNKNILILCSGWKGKFNLEDSIYAGALASNIMASKKYETTCDSVHAAMDLWNIAKEDLLEYVEKASHRHRLKNMVLDDIMEYSFTVDSTNVVPVLDGGKLVDVLK